LVLSFHFGQLVVECGFDHVPDLSLGLRDKNFEREPGNSRARFLLEEKISDLRTVSVSDYDAILLREARDLSNRDGKVIELFVYRPAFAFADERVAAKRNQQNRPCFIFMS
jgi:hypothetical protein